MSLVIVTTYTGNLVAALTTQHVKLPFRNLEELADDKEYSLTVVQDTAVQVLFEVCIYHVFQLVSKSFKGIINPNKSSKGA